MSDVKVITIDQIHPAEHLLGKFLDESHYDILIDYDCDVYKPNTTLEKGNGEHNILLKFRKNVFDPKMISVAYDGLKEAAVESANRGVAAGPRYEKSTGRDWLTCLQSDVLETLSGSMTTVFGDDPVVALYEKYKNNSELEKATKGVLWLTTARPADFDFDKWAMWAKDLPEAERLAEVEKVQSWISHTQYANPVFSGIAGFFDRYPRIPYCRTTSYSQRNKEKFDVAIPFIEAVSNQFELLLPERFAAQKEAMSHLDPEFHIGESVYTTITVNKNYRTAAHRDAGDLAAGFGNLSVVWDGEHDWDGCYLVFPAFRAAVNVRPGDILMADVHGEIHGNTMIYPKDTSGKHGRISIVCYMREKMADCKTKAYEDARLAFVNSRKHLTANNTGVTPGMWETEEWYQFLLNNGLHEYANEIRDKVGKAAVLDI